MIYDCFTFFNELDLLEIRLNILNDYVDKFVIVESTRTFNNKKKKLYYEENKERYKKFEDKIIHIVMDEFSPEEDIGDWTIENSQRNCIMKGLKNCSDDDIIIISDLDEIPRPELIRQAYNPNKIIAFDCDVYNYFLNNYIVGYEWTHGPKMLSYKNFKHILDDCKLSDTYAIDTKVNKGTTPCRIRLYYGAKQTHIKKGGWHFSYMGDVDVIMDKIRACFEYEPISNKDDCLKMINSKKFLDTYYLVPVEIDETFPEYIQKNIDKYSDFIIRDNCKRLGFWNGTVKYGFKYLMDNIFAIKTQTKFGIKRTILILFGIKMRIKKEKVQ